MPNHLQRWGLEIDGQPDAPVELGDASGATIPDDKNGIERTLTALSSGRSKAVEVTVGIAHTCIGDLVLELVSPARLNVVLHESEVDPVSAPRDMVVPCTRQHKFIRTPQPRLTYGRWSRRACTGKPRWNPYRSHLLCDTTSQE